MPGGQTMAGMGGMGCCGAMMGGMGGQAAGGQGTTLGLMNSMMLDASDWRTYGAMMKLRGELMKAMGELLIQHGQAVERANQEKPNQ